MLRQLKPSCANCTWIIAKFMTPNFVLGRQPCCVTLPLLQNIGHQMFAKNRSGLGFRLATAFSTRNNRAAKPAIRLPAQPIAFRCWMPTSGADPHRSLVADKSLLSCHCFNIDERHRPASEM